MGLGCWHWLTTAYASAHVATLSYTSLRVVQGAMWATVRVRPFMVFLYHNTEDILLADGDVAKVR